MVVITKEFHTEFKPQNINETNQLERAFPHLGHIHIGQTVCVLHSLRDFILIWSSES